MQERRPVAVLFVERHEQFDFDPTLPLDRQGEHRLNRYAKGRAHLLGKRIFDFLASRCARNSLKKQGVYLHLAPTPFVRARETAYHTGRGFEYASLVHDVPLVKAERHLAPVQSLRFLKIPPRVHGPKGTELEKTKKDEARWAAGKAIEGFEELAKAAHRTKTPHRLRRMIEQAIRNRKFDSSTPLPVFGWVSHGAVAPPEQCQTPRSPIGLALNRLFTPRERQRFKIPAELARGDAVAIVFYNDGKIHANRVTSKL